MEPYQYFGLAVAPFDGRLDPRFFYASPSHAETLATLQYAVHTGKTCSLVLGDSGSGKTLIGRLLVQRLAPRIAVLWVYGIGQPGGQTEVTIYPPGGLDTPDAPRRQPVEESSLATWIRSGLPAAPATLVIFDNADGLPVHSWEDILSLVTREVRTPKPVSIVLFGLPTLADRLAAPELVRLRRRIFRTCQLQRLTREIAEGYVRHRLKVAGGNGHEIFTAAAFDLIHRFSGGIPALINHICDNAMVDAFGEERQQIDARHVTASVQAITGGLLRARALPSVTLPPRAGALPVPAGPYVAEPLAAARSSDEPGQPERARSDGTPAEVGAGAELAAQAGGGVPSDYGLPGNAHDLRGSGVASATVIPVSSRAIGQVVTRSAPGIAGTATTVGACSYVPLDQRLQALESRLSDALSRVREARSRKSLSPVTEAVATTESDVGACAAAAVPVDEAPAPTEVEVADGGGSPVESAGGPSAPE